MIFRNRGDLFPDGDGDGLGIDADLVGLKDRLDVLWIDPRMPFGGRQLPDRLAKIAKEIVAAGRSADVGGNADAIVEMAPHFLDGQEALGIDRVEKRGGQRDPVEGAA